MNIMKALIKSKIPKEALEYSEFYQHCEQCDKETMHYGSECILLYCSECGLVTSDDMDEEVKQLDLEE